MIHSLLFNPLHQFLEVGAFAVAENPYAVYLGTQPHRTREGGDHQDDGQPHLPEWYVGNGDSGNHHDGGAEGNQRAYDGEGAVGIFHGLEHDKIGDKNGHHDREHVLLGVGFRVNGGADGCEQRTVNEIPQQKEDNKIDNQGCFDSRHVEEEREGTLR